MTEISKEVTEIIKELSTLGQQFSGSEMGRLTYWVIWWKYLGYEIFRRGISFIMFLVATFLLLRKRKQIYTALEKESSIGDDIFVYHVTILAVFGICALGMFG